MASIEAGVKEKKPELAVNLLQGVPSEMAFTGYTWTTKIGDSGEEIEFPIMTVNPDDSPEKHTSIAYVNSQRPEFVRSGSRAIIEIGAEIINRRQPDFVLAVTLPTKKSKELSGAVIDGLKRNTGKFTRIESLTLPGGQDLVERGIICNQQVLQSFPWGVAWEGVEVASGELVQGCSWTPVTRKNKSIFMTQKAKSELAQVNYARNGLIFNIDDLITTGFTISGVQFAETALGSIEDSRIETIAVAWETGALQNLPSNWHYATQFKEWVGQF